jgi:hypothetical protein
MSDLLKEALADAKAVRATALANAKVALEEAFGERVQALFAERLKEESADDVMSSDNDGSSNETMMQPSDDGMSNEETLSDGELEEIIAELERDAEMSEEGEPAPADPNAMTAPMDPTAVPAPAPAPVSDTPMTTAPVSDTPMAAAPVAPVAPAAPVAPVDPSLAPAAPAAEDIEEISLDELLAELESGEESGEGSDHDQKEGSHEESDYAEQIAEVTAQRDQAMKTVEILRSQINEVNLLNAKLLYTNKLFKQFSMNNEQKMKVVENFDLTTSVREVKLTYAIMAESFNLGGSVVRRKNTTATTITEGLASKAVASTKPSQPIVANGNLMAERFKTLAGIKK